MKWETGIGTLEKLSLDFFFLLLLHWSPLVDVATTDYYASTQLEICLVFMISLDVCANTTHFYMYKTNTMAGEKVDFWYFYQIINDISIEL